MKADQVRTQFGVTGAGQIVGVIGDTVNATQAVGAGTVTGTVPNAVLTNTTFQITGDAPASIGVVDFGPPTSTDPLTSGQPGQDMGESVHGIDP